MGVALGALAVGAKLLAGYNAKQANRREASALEAQGLLLRDEQYAEARRRADETRKLRAKQKLAFLANGVTITGTPTLTLEETTREGQEEVNALARRGDNYANLAYRKASIMRSEGRAAFIGSIFDAIGTGASMSAKSQSPTSGLGGIGSNYGTPISGAGWSGVRHA